MSTWKADAGPPRVRQGSRLARPAPPGCGLDRPAAARLLAAKRSWPHVSAVASVWTETWRPQRSVARASAILLAQVPCETPVMARPRKPHRENRAAGDALPDDLHDYARPPPARPGRPAPGDPATWTVKDDWPDYAPVTEAEIEVFEAWFGD